LSNKKNKSPVKPTRIKRKAPDTEEKQSPEPKSKAPVPEQGEDLPDIIEALTKAPSATSLFGEGEELPGPNPADLPSRLPVLAVRDIVVFNYMILPLFVGREKSIMAVDEALAGERYILILTQKDESVEDPGPDDLYMTGTVGMIMRMLKMPDGDARRSPQGPGPGTGPRQGEAVHQERPLPHGRAGTPDRAGSRRAFQ